MENAGIWYKGKIMSRTKQRRIGNTQQIRYNALKADIDNLNRKLAKHEVDTAIKINMVQDGALTSAEKLTRNQEEIVMTFKALLEKMGVMAP